jgi:hypothetical protein
LFKIKIKKTAFFWLQVNVFTYRQGDLIKLRLGAKPAEHIHG